MKMKQKIKEMMVYSFPALFTLGMFLYWLFIGY